MGIEPFLLSSSLIGVLAQRLVRRICPDCKEEIAVKKATWDRLGLTGEKMVAYQGKGCPKCSKRGYKGRIALYEVMAINDPVRDIIIRRGSSEEIRRRAQEHGMKTLSESGIEMMKAGITTIDEVLRVTQEFQEL
jgi:type IV pilus assembly protein PilB